MYRHRTAIREYLKVNPFDKIARHLAVVRVYESASVMDNPAVIFHNVVDLTDVLRNLKREGYLLTREDVAVLSPYMTSHIKRFGDYLIDMETVPQILDEAGALIF